MKKEIWKSIPGWKGRYDVSNLGRVRSLARPFRPTTKVMRGQTHAGGYIIYTFWKNGEPTIYFGHRLVLLSFRRKRKTHECARHLNGSRTDNRLTNLVWGTHRENQADREIHGTGRIGKKRGNTPKLGAETVFSLRRQFKVSGLSITAFAKLAGLPRTTVADFVRGRTY